MRNFARSIFGAFFACLNLSAKRRARCIAVRHSLFQVTDALEVRTEVAMNPLPSVELQRRLSSLIFPHGDVGESDQVEREYPGGWFVCYVPPGQRMQHDRQNVVPATRQSKRWHAEVIEWIAGGPVECPFSRPL